MINEYYQLGYFTITQNYKLISIKLFIAGFCEDRLPNDYGGTSGCNWECSDWASANNCDDDWPRHCVDTPSGKIKDYCRLACGNCIG